MMKINPNETLAQWHARGGCLLSAWATLYAKQDGGLRNTRILENEQPMRRVMETRLARLEIERFAKSTDDNGEW